jgi:hypothetical protein
MRQITRNVSLGHRGQKQCTFVHFWTCSQTRFKAESPFASGARETAPIPPRQGAASLPRSNLAPRRSILFYRSFWATAQLHLMKRTTLAVQLGLPASQRSLSMGNICCQGCKSGGTLPSTTRPENRRSAVA